MVLVWCWFGARERENNTVHSLSLTPVCLLGAAQNRISHLPQRVLPSLFLPSLSNPLSFFLSFSGHGQHFTSLSTTLDKIKFCWGFQAAVCFVVHHLSCTSQCSLFYKLKHHAYPYPWYRHQIKVVEQIRRRAWILASQNSLSIFSLNLDSLKQGMVHWSAVTALGILGGTVEHGKSWGLSGTVFPCSAGEDLVFDGKSVQG